MTSYLVLGTVQELGEATPYDLKQAMSQSTGHFWSVPHAMLYSEPARLAKAGLLGERQEQTGRRRKLYTVTEAGAEAFAAWLAEPPETMYELREPGILKLFFGADPRMVASAQLPKYQAWFEKLQEQRSTLEDAVRAGVVAPGPLRALRAGVAFAEQSIALWTELLDDQEGENVGDGQERQSTA
ncbi:PadR family transcriptional regulator [Segniliparus rugosus]|uniref:Transcription regulator PadR N-terminal domain-containing protein n=1 Tax=Segniliparus rugosus (strain ATCC BAA-974 / DSM 45345 / CCUG 50838 / CIP 108380 / JCM 13579 / CDC 945) TaxID=679197 RepID=E5XVE4_SEGRC|nr:PadR family transcriptional regulator [Segniliparus rugosus]EFV11684.1 hypothetical protein HMPREF9336_03466 [Segniliparus rugosus ATCC BAA-974]